MYFIDRTKINTTLSHMEELLHLFEQEKSWDATPVHSLALERMAHNIIESIIDVGNTMIDGFIMRDPGSYEDIIDIMEDEKVISSEMASPLKQVIELRQMIVREFTNVNSRHIVDTLTSSMAALKTFPGNVRAYLENELGPVSAFLPVNEQ